MEGEIGLRAVDVRVCHEGEEGADVECEFRGGCRLAREEGGGAGKEREEGCEDEGGGTHGGRLATRGRFGIWRGGEGGEVGWKDEARTRISTAEDVGSLVPDVGTEINEFELLVEDELKEMYKLLNQKGRPWNGRRCSAKCVYPPPNENITLRTHPKYSSSIAGLPQKVSASDTPPRPTVHGITDAFLHLGSLISVSLPHIG